MNKQESISLFREYEIAFSRWLQRHREWSTLAAYDYSGKGGDKAPLLFGKNAQIVVPDLFGCKAGGSAWFEIKYKSHADETFMRARRVDPNCPLETGIDRHLWQHYLKVRDESGLEVWLVFIHRKEGEVRAASITELREPDRHRIAGGMGRGGMAFFSWNHLRFVARYVDVLREEPLLRRRGGGPGSDAARHRERAA